MSRVRYLADEDLRGDIIRATRRLEPSLDLVTANEAGLGGRPDDEVLEFAQLNARIVVSHDVNIMTGAAIDRIASGRGLSGLFLALQSRRRERSRRAWS